MPAAPPPEIAAFLSFMARRGLDHCILHAASEHDPMCGGGDLDVYVEPSALSEVSRFLAQEGWRADESERFRRSRHYWSRIAGGRKLKIDLSTVYAVYGARECWVLRDGVQTRVGSDGFPYLTDPLGAAFAARKAMAKGAEAPPGAASARADTLFDKGRCGGFSVWGWLRARLRWARPARGRLTVALVGLDGAGKGTQADLLASELTRRGFLVGRRYLGYSAFRLEALRSVIAIRDRRERGLLFLLAHAAYLGLLPLEFALRRGVGSYDVLLTDRHPRYEPVFSDRRPSLYDRLLVGLCPRPDLVVYLTGDADTLWSRKREMEPATFRAKERVLDGRVRGHEASTPTVRVDATEPLDEVFRKVLLAVEARLA